MTEQEKQDILTELMALIRAEGLEYGGNPIKFDDPFNITQTERQNVKIPAIDERSATPVHGNVDLEALLTAYGVTHVEEIASDISSKYMKKTADSNLNMNGNNVNNAGNLYTKTEVDTALDGKVDNMYMHSGGIPSTGWYNIGIIHENNNGGSAGENTMARLYINGDYVYQQPNGCVVDIASSWSYAGINKAVDIPSDTQVTKVRLRRVPSGNDKSIYIDIYYAPNLANTVRISLRTYVGVFEGNGFTAVTDLGATSVVAERDLTEWENPPMAVGVEYKTTERVEGEVVYKKLIYCGAVSASTTTTVAHGISGVEFFITAKLFSASQNAIGYNSGVTITGNATNIYIKTGSGVSASPFVLLEYTKS